ncbi:PRTRC genetic system protein B [Paraburkholderia sp. JPY465]|uniref:PRTRC system protein B n=1 Tax=Paraburkholderia sp. JPY465 TaxID=3042285 RepID=UPI003D1C2870
MKDVIIHHRGNVDLELDAALLLYRSSAGHVYATQHSVRIVDERPVLLPGVPITLEGLADFADLAAKRTSYRGFVHDRIVYVAPNVLAWWVPACTRRVWFRSEDAIGERAGDANHPPLVFIVSKSGWLIFALRENVRPGPATKMYTAPYYNVWENGEICAGNAETPDSISPDSIKAFEDAFFRSRFTHPNNTRLIHRRGGAERLWLDLLDGAEFPIDRLISRSQSLADVIDNLKLLD